MNVLQKTRSVGDVQNETRPTGGRHAINEVMDAMMLRVARWGVFVLLAVVFILTLVMLARNGIFGITDTFSDEHDHYKRSLMFSSIVRGNLSLEAIGTFYSGGIWPPLYPMVIGSIQAVTNSGTALLRLVNVLFAYGGCALLIASVPSRIGQYAGVVVVGLFAVGTHYYYQIRPENLVLLILGALTFLVTRAGLFSVGLRSKRSGSYALCGALCALACLTHAFLALVSVYLIVLSLLAFRERLWFILAFAIVAGPYVLAQAMIHNGFVLFSTTAEENLARNNNSFLRDHERPLADDLLFQEMERRYKAGDKVVYPRPLVLPQARYDQWLHDENKRRIFKQMAMDEVRADPMGAAVRMTRRVTNLVGGEGCTIGERYGCNIGPMTDLLAFYLLAVMALIGLVMAAKSELSRITSFSFAMVCCALLAPMIATQAVGRQFIIVLITASFGGLIRYRALQF